MDIRVLPFVRSALVCVGPVCRQPLILGFDLPLDSLEYTRRQNKHMLQAAAPGYQWLYGGRPAGSSEPKSEAILIPNAILVTRQTSCIGILEAGGAYAQPAQNLSPKPASQTSQPG